MKVKLYSENKKKIKLARKKELLCKDMYVSDKN